MALADRVAAARQVTLDGGVQSLDAPVSAPPGAEDAEPSEALEGGGGGRRRQVGVEGLEQRPEGLVLDGGGIEPRHVAAARIVEHLEDAAGVARPDRRRQLVDARLVTEAVAGRELDGGVVERTAGRSIVDW